MLYDHSELEAWRSSGCSIYMEYSLPLYLYTRIRAYHTNILPCLYRLEPHPISSHVIYTQPFLYAHDTSLVRPCLFIYTLPNPASPLSQPSHISYPTTHPLRTNPLLHMSQVLPAHRVPALHVLLHAVRIARRFRGREGGAGFGDAALEAVFVEFLTGICVSRILGEWLEGMVCTSTSCLAF